MPTRKHGLIQARLAHLITRAFQDFEAASKVTVQIRTGRYLVPDLVVQRCDRIQDPYPSEPVHLCIEILSPGDRMSEIFAKCEEYHAWGVETAWVVDPEAQRAWEYRSGRRPAEVPGSGSLTADGISISLPEIFSVLWR
jgi:Uma2 family endonuclease